MSVKIVAVVVCATMAGLLAVTALAMRGAPTSEFAASPGRVETAAERTWCSAGLVEYPAPRDPASFRAAIGDASGSFAFLGEAERSELVWLVESGDPKVFHVARAVRSATIVDALSLHAACVESGGDCELGAEIVHLRIGPAYGAEDWGALRDVWQGVLRRELALARRCVGS